jgi:N-glycosylase/DNA lyase
MSAVSRTFPVRDYNLAATLTSGQAFRWHRHDRGWSGVVHSHWVLLRADEFSITAEAAVPTSDWTWLEDYLQLHIDLGAVIRTFPDDQPLRASTLACRGLRLLRQDPWECLASFILSSTKQIVQIRQIVAALCERFGESVEVAPSFPREHSFPTPERLARATEAELRSCKMGFRAPYLLQTARAIAGGQFELHKLRLLPVESARHELMQLPGVGPKIADCVLLFAYGFQSAFPVDVWVMKALQQLYFPRRRVSRKRLEKFTQTYFGPNAGYAQQYLFHYMRTARATPKPVAPSGNKRRAGKPAGTRTAVA